MSGTQYEPTGAGKIWMIGQHSRVQLSLEAARERLSKMQRLRWHGRVEYSDLEAAIALECEASK